MKKIANYLMLFGGLVILGMSGALLKQSTLKAEEILMMTTMFAAVDFCIWHFATKQEFKFIKYTKDFLLVSGAGACFGGFLILFLNAFEQVGKGSLFAILLGILFLYGISTLLLKEAMTRNSLIGLALLLVGGIILLYPTIPAFRHSLGILFVVTAALCLCGFGILFKMANKFSISEKSTFSMAFCFMALAIYVGVKEGFMIYIPNKEFIWLGVFFVAIVCVGCRVFWYGYEALKTKYTCVASGILLPIAVFSYIVFYKNTITLPDVIGFLFVLAGIIYVTYHEIKLNEKPMHVEFKSEDTDIVL